MSNHELGSIELADKLQLLEGELARQAAPPENQEVSTDPVMRGFAAAALEVLQVDDATRTVVADSLSRLDRFGAPASFSEIVHKWRGLVIRNILQESYMHQTGRRIGRRSATMEEVLRIAREHYPSWPADYEDKGLWKEAIRKAIFEPSEGSPVSQFEFSMMFEPIHSNDPSRAEPIKRTILPLLKDRFKGERLRILEVGTSRLYILKALAAGLKGGDFAIIDPITREIDDEKTRQADEFARRNDIDYEELTGVDAWHIEDMGVWLLGIANSLRPKDYTDPVRLQTFIEFEDSHPETVTFVPGLFSKPSDYEESVSHIEGKDLTSPYHAILFPTVFYMLPELVREMCLEQSKGLVHPDGFELIMDLGEIDTSEKYGIHLTDSWFGKLDTYHIVIRDLLRQELGFQPAMTMDSGRPSRGYYHNSEIGNRILKIISTIPDQV